MTPPPPRVAGLVLAAGASRRMGRPKMVLPVGSTTLLAASVSPLLEADLDPVVVVLGCEAETIRRHAGLPEDPRLEVVVAEDWASGMAASLRRGLDACGAADAVLVALGDQPDATAEGIRRLVAALAAGAPLAVPVRGGRAGHPVLFARALWPELRALAGDVGGRDVVRRHWAEAALVEQDLPRDVDTEEDYRALVDGRPARGGEGLEAPDPPDRRPRRP